MLTELPELIVGFAVGLAIMRAGHILLILRPRRLRSLEAAFDRDYERRRVETHGLRCQLKDVVRENRWLSKEAALVPKLTAEVVRLRELNGETYQKYVKAQDRYEQLMEGRSPRI